MRLSWDYQIQLHRPDWATIYEHRPPKGNPEDIEDILTEYKPIVHRIRQIIDDARNRKVINRAIQNAITM
jgi:hypothetical protein